MMIKVCILCDNGSVHNQKWIDGLRSLNDLELHIMSFDKGIKFDNVHYYKLGRYTNTKIDYFLNVPLVRTYIKIIKPDILHAQYATSYGYLAARTNFHPFLLTGWGSDIFDSPRHFLMRSIVRIALTRADAITVLSVITQLEVKKLCRRDSILIPFGVDVNLFQPEKKINEDLLIIGTIRTLSPKYGVEFLIKAFKNVQSEYNQVRLEIVGDGPQRQELETLCKSLGIYDKVKFYGYINQKQEPEKYVSILKQFDVFTILSTLDSETFGVAAVEASACGIPVVASRIGGLPEVIDDGITGILVKPSDVGEIESAIKKLVADKNLRLSMGKAGRHKAETIYNWDLSIKKMSELYRSMLTNYKKTQA